MWTTNLCTNAFFLHFKARSPLIYTFCKVYLTNDYGNTIVKRVRPSSFKLFFSLPKIARCRFSCSMLHFFQEKFKVSLLPSDIFHHSTKKHTPLIPADIVCHECHWSLRSLTISDWEGVFQPIINIIYNIYYDGECIRKSLMTLLTRDTLDTPCRMEVLFFEKK